MAIYKLQEMTDLHKTGKRKVYPKMVVNRTLSQSEFVKMMRSYHRGISPSITEAVLMDVKDTLLDLLSMGYNVKLDEMGTFSLSLGFEDNKSTEMQDDKDKMNYRKVGVKDINFCADSKFVKAMKQETDKYLERDMGGVKVIRKQQYTLDERIARAVEYIDKEGMLTLNDYAFMNNLSRTAASLELKKITSSASSLIQSKGTGSHKIWVKRKE